MNARTFAPVIAAVSTLAISFPAKGNFEGPYSLTPPEPGVYTGPELALFTPNWKAAGANASVNTTEAPARLELSIPSGSIFANLLQFSTRAAADGTVSFDAATVSRAGLEGGFIAWFRQTPVGTPKLTLLDQALDGEWRHFTFEVEAGDTFGFQLGSGSDAIDPDEAELNTLTIDNFFAPVPEPGTGALLAAIGVLTMARLHRCSSALDPDQKEEGPALRIVLMPSLAPT